MSKPLRVKLINGGVFSDNKGTLRFVNNFTFKGVKRFYQIDINKKNIVRAFHGHMRESKTVFVISGSILLCLAKINDPKNPSKKIKIKKIVLDSKSPKVCIIPPKYANGFMSLEKNTKVIFYSDRTLEESEKDDFRFPKKYWGEVWGK